MGWSVQRREALARTVVAGPPRPRGSLSFPPCGDRSPGTGPSRRPCGFLCCTLSPDHFHSSGSNEALPSAEKAPYREEIPGGASNSLRLLWAGRARPQHLSAVPRFGFGGLVHHGIIPGGQYCDGASPPYWPAVRVHCFGVSPPHWPAVHVHCFRTWAFCLEQDWLGLSLRPHHLPAVWLGTFAAGSLCFCHFDHLSGLGVERDGWQPGCRGWRRVSGALWPC